MMAVWTNPETDNNLVRLNLDGTFCQILNFKKDNLLKKTESDISGIAQYLVLSVYGMIGVSFPMFWVHVFSNIDLP